MILHEWQKARSHRHIMLGARRCGMTTAACAWAWDMAQEGPVAFICQSYMHWRHIVVPVLVGFGGVYEPSKRRVTRTGGAYIEYMDYPTGFGDLHSVAVDGWPPTPDHSAWLGVHRGPQFRTIPIPSDVTVEHAGSHLQMDGAF